MATELKKDVTRESTVEKDGKKVMVTLTEKQEIVIRLKGKKKEHAKFTIEELYDMNDEKAKKTSKKENSKAMISLHDLRSSNAVSSLDYKDKAKFDSIIKDMIERYQ